MIANAKLRYLRIAPRKVRLVADLIRGKTVEQAQTILNFTTKKAAQVMLKLLKSAIYNAKNKFQLEEKNLYISKILVDEGPKYKRWMPRARGAASPIQKKTSHVAVVLDTLEKKPKKVKKVKKAEEAREVAERPLISRPRSAQVVEKLPKLAEDSSHLAPHLRSAVEKPKLKPEIEEPKPKTKKGIGRIFRRKAF